MSIPLDRTEVEPLFKPDNYGPCGCGCQKVGRYKKDPWKDGTRCIVRDCVCRRCTGRKVKKNSGNRERRMAKQIGGTRSVLSGALNGADITGPIDIEETSNKAICRGFMSWVNGKGVQAKTARLLARRTDVPRALVLSPDGKPSWLVMPWEDAVQFIKSKEAG